MKEALTPDEVLAVATAHLADNIEQQAIARLIGINNGRVSEACAAIDYARRHVKAIYKLSRGEATLTIKENGK